MKNRIIGLGIFALIFSLNLLFLGSLGVKPNSPEVLYAQCDSGGEEVQADLSEIRFQDVIFQQKAENTHFSQLVRKFPAALGYLFLLLNLRSVANPDSRLAARLSYLPTKDLPVNFRNLRI